MLFWSTAILTVPLIIQSLLQACVDECVRTVEHFSSDQPLHENKVVPYRQSIFVKGFCVCLKLLYHRCYMHGITVYKGVGYKLFIS